MLKEMWLITNYSCNHRCKWCYTTDKNFVNQNMPLSFAEQTLTEMYKLGVRKCTLIGGEPTLYPHIKEVLKTGSDLGILMKIVTNGVKIGNKEYLKELKENGLGFVAISIHGITRESYKANTQTDDLESVENAIKNCNELNIPYVTLTTLNKLNCDSVVDIVKYLNKLEVKNIVFNIAVPYTNSKTIEKNVLSPKEIAEVIERNYHKLKKENLKAGFYASIPLCLFKEENLNNMIKEKYLIPLSEGGCNIYDKTGFAFEPNGNVIPCCKKFKEVLLNTQKNENFIYRENPKEMWNKIKDNFGHKAMPFPSKKCDKCKYKKDCIGGCPMFWTYFDKEKYVLGVD